MNLEELKALCKQVNDGSLSLRDFHEEVKDLDMGESGGAFIEAGLVQQGDGATAGNALSYYDFVEGEDNVLLHKVINDEEYQYFKNLGVSEV